MPLKAQPKSEGKVASKQRASKPPAPDKAATTEHLNSATFSPQARFGSGLLTPHNALQLQSIIGNQATQQRLQAKADNLEVSPGFVKDKPALMALQRQPNAPAPAPPKQLPGVEAQVTEVYDLYKALNEKLTVAQLAYHSSTRSALREEFEKKIKFHRLDPYMEGGGDPAQVQVETKRIKKAIEECEEILNKHHTEAFESWLSLQEEYQDEQKRLQEMPDYVSETALQLLSKQYQKTEKRVTEVGAALVEEDLMDLDKMFDSESYLEDAVKQVRKEEEALAADYEDFTGEPLPEGPGTLELIWSVVGFDGPGDLLLSLLTGGTIKAIKVARRLRRARKVYKAAKATKKLAKAKRLEKAANAAKVISRLTKLLKSGFIKDQVNWIKSNWKSVSRKIATDLAAAYQVDNFSKLSSVALGRIEKEFISATVQNILGSSSDEEKLYMQLSLAALATGKTDAANRMLRAYIGMNGRRRLLTNVIFVSLRKTGRLEFPVARDALAEIIASTASEMVQDAVLAIPFLDVPVVSDLIETERKIWQSRFQEFLRDALGV